jgi:hypothetical protein
MLDCGPTDPEQSRKLALGRQNLSGLNQPQHDLAANLFGHIFMRADLLDRLELHFGAMGTRADTSDILGSAAWTCRCSLSPSRKRPWMDRYALRITRAKGRETGYFRSCHGTGDTCSRWSRRRKGLALTPKG